MLFHSPTARKWLASILFLMCTSALSAPSSAQQVDPSRFRLSQPDGTYVRALRSTWNLTGYGWLLKLTADSATVYNYAGDLCWRDPLLSGDLAKQVLTRYYAFPRRPLRVNFAETPEGTQYPARWMQFTPAICKRPPDTSPQFTFEAVAATLKDYYPLPFASARGVNWSERIARLRPLARAARSDAELKAVMEQLLSGLGDPHTSISGNVDETYFTIGSRSKFTFARLHEAFAQQSEIDDFFAYTKAWRNQQQEMVFATLETTSRRRLLGDNVVWGRLPGDVGYLAVEQIGDFGEGASLTQERELLASALDTALDDLADTRAIILDLSNSLGGYESAAHDIASRFTNTNIVSYYKKPNSQNHTMFQEVTIRPAVGRRYTRPVVLLTSDMTVSASEIVVLAMRNFPNVRHVGTATQGALSAMLSKGLPNGWALGITSEVVLDPHGRSFEVSGIPPAVEFPVYESADFDLGRLNAILRAQQLALTAQ
ncbi:MAG: S41 family peptidase [Rhodanobacteraceae bacterium]|nr:S41 family peptidase [Rhodanobacteraceae bacterium]